jgi:hypothetical protein
MARERYVDQVRLRVDILPAVAVEEDFALKGSTAINLFYRDLPRLSVDVDLAFLMDDHPSKIFRRMATPVNAKAPETKRPAELSLAGRVGQIVLTN